MNASPESSKQLSCEVLPLARSKPTGTVSTVRDEEEAEIHRLQAMIRNSPDLINGAPSSEAPLIAAARAGRVRVVKFLLDNGANINVVSQGKTALHNAVQFGNRAMVELLLQRGADVKAKDGTGGTPLHEAAQNGFLSIVEVLLQHKADLNARNSKANYELSPLHLAVKNGHAALVGFLLANGDDVNRKASGWTPLHGAAASGHDAMVTSLLKAGADVNAADNDGDTPLMDAAERGHLLSVKALLAAKADPEVVDQKGRTALSYAADSGHVQIVQTLLDAGAKPDLGKLDLPLLVAVRGQKHQIADLLLSRGAGPNLESKSSVQISGDQSFSGGRQPSGSGKSVFGPYQPLHAAVARKDVAMVTLLLKWKANPNIKQNSTWFTPVSPLLFSVLDNEAMLQAFLEAGADANARSSVNDTPALVSAAAFGQQEAVRLLLKYKAKVNDADGEKRTALLFAAERGDLEMTKLLLTHQPDVNAPNAVCNSPLHGAVWVGHKEIVALLLEHGANPNVRGGSGLTPLDYTKPGSNARSANKRTDEVWRELAELLRKHGALDDLPDFTRVRITRQGVDRPFVVFYKAAKLTNHFSLLETVMSFYARGPGIVNDKAFWPAKDLGFPDLSRVIIRRPSQTPGGKAQEIRIGLLNASNVVDCARDVPVEFGDVIEIPERVHALNEAPMDPVREMERTFMEANRATLPERQLRGVSGMETNAVMLTIRAQEAARKADAQRLACLQKTVQLIVAGERASFTVDSWKEGFLSQALAKPQARAVLRSSSDLARVEVTRQDAKTGKPVILIVDAANILQPGDDLWLRGGDVIEVPDKP
jgi:ankyrin repeat protein